MPLRFRNLYAASKTNQQLEEGLHPFHSESERDYLAHLGLYITTWSAFELLLYELARNVAALDLKFSAPQQMPLKAKLRILRNAFESRNELAEEREEALALLDFAEDEAEFRHVLIHGANNFCNKPEPWVAGMWRPEKVTGEPAVDDIRQVTQRDLEQHISKVGLAGFGVARLGRIVLDLRSKKIESMTNGGGSDL